MRKRGFMKRAINLNDYSSLSEVPEAQELFEKCDILCACIVVDRFNAERDRLRKPLPADPNPLMAVISTDGKIEIMSRKCCRKKFGAVEWYEDFDRVTFAGDYGLPIIYRRGDTVNIGEDEYVVGPFVACRIDENGNEVSVDGLTISKAYRFLKDNTVSLCVGGEEYNAFKL